MKQLLFLILISPMYMHAMDDFNGFKSEINQPGEFFPFPNDGKQKPDTVIDIDRIQAMNHLKSIESHVAQIKKNQDLRPYNRSLEKIIETAEERNQILRVLALIVTAYAGIDLLFK